MVYKHAYLNLLLILHTAFLLSGVKMPLKGEVGGLALNSHGNDIFDRGKSWKNHGIVFLNFGMKNEFFHIFNLKYFNFFQVFEVMITDKGFLNLHSFISRTLTL